MTDNDHVDAPLLPMSANQNGAQQGQYQELNANNNTDNRSSDGPTTHIIKNKLGTINGCYVPCLLNIMGIILFERLGWGIGQRGVSGVFGIFCIAEFQAILTVLSLSAIVTNGNMRGGGSYYMISRTLGPEFGGSIGLLFYSAYCVGVAFYSMGFAEELVDTWYDDYTGTQKYWLQIMWASVILGICLAVALAGAGWFTKINVFLFFWQFLAIVIALLACFVRGTFWLDAESSEVCDSDSDEYYKHYAWTWSRFTDNWLFDCTGTCKTFSSTFAVLFPAATGIMEGANLSGDLANPTYSIPVGTLGAIGTSILFYVLLIIAFAGSFNQCTLRNDTTIMQEAAWGEVGTYLVIAGILISASSSALGSLFGGSRVLQAIARDKLFPYTKWFEYGSPRGDEPRVAVLFTWLIAQGLVFIGNLDSIAPIATAFFCLSYCTVNFSCFLLEISGTPNFRPSFTYYTWHTCLMGTITNFVVMFYVDYAFGIAAFVTEVAVFIFLAYRAPQNVWGDVTQSIIFHQVRKYLLRLDIRKAHSKTWRPSVLLLADTEQIALIDFCNNLKKGGLYIIGTVLLGDFEGKVEVLRRIKANWVEFVDRNKLKAFAQIAVSSSLRAGFENLILLSGLGAMEPNTIVVPMWRMQGKKEPEEEEEKIDSLEIADDKETNGLLDVADPSGNEIAQESLKTLVLHSPADMEAVEYVRLCRNILKFNRNVVMTANMDALDFHLVVAQNIAQTIEKTQHVEDDGALQPELESVVVSNSVNLQQKEDSQSLIPAFSSLQQSNYWTFAQQKTPDMRNQWVDIWLFADDYSFSLEDSQRDQGFPMLIMQLSHILLQNKVWDKAAGLRVFLLVDSRWNEEDQHNFDGIVKELRLGIDQVVVLKQPSQAKPTWQSIESGQATQREWKKYYARLNATMVSLSTQTYFTFLKLPPLPPIDDVDAKRAHAHCTMYFEGLYLFLRNMPPTALIATGEELPVISMDI